MNNNPNPIGVLTGGTHGEFTYNHFTGTGETACYPIRPIRTVYCPAAVTITTTDGTVLAFIGDDTAPEEFDIRAALEMQVAELTVTRSAVSPLETTR